MMNEELLQTLIADLGKDYDPNAALKFLKILESDTTNKKTQIARKNLESLLNNPPNEDTTLHVIYKTPYVLGEIVLSGKNTISKHPLCQFYPIHFKKTYLKELSRWETNPAHEARQSHRIWKHFQSEGANQNLLEQNQPKSRVPLPLGSTPSSYRSQLLEAKSVGALSPVNSNAPCQELLKQILDFRKSQGSLLNLWKGIESLNQSIDLLHQGGFLHNDLHKENLLIHEGESMPQGCLIDFETSEEDERFNTLEWERATKNDKRLFLKEASLIFLCAPPKEQKIIIQNSPLAKEIAQIFKTDPLFISLLKDLEQPHIEHEAVPKEKIQTKEHLKRVLIPKKKTKQNNIQI